MAKAKYNVTLTDGYYILKTSELDYDLKMIMLFTLIMALSLTHIKLLLVKKLIITAKVAI